MKKTISTLMLLLAVSLSARAQAIEAVNYMGATVIDTPAAGGFEVLTLSTFSDGDDTVSIQDVIQNKIDLNAGGVGQKDDADKIHVWTGGGYTSYGLFQPDSGDPFWADTGQGGWDYNFMTVDATTNEISRGTSLWYETGNAGSSTNILVSGQVYTGENYTVEVDQFTLVSYPFSSELSLQGLVVSNSAAATVGNKESADKIHVWTGGGYTSYGLFQPDSGDPFWADTGQGGWDYNFMTVDEATTIINLGKGFWYESPSGAKTIGFMQNYTLTAQ